MSLCTRCGQSVAPGASFCGRCGAPAPAPTSIPAGSGHAPAWPSGPFGTSPTGLTGADFSTAAVSALAGLGATAVLPLVLIVALATTVEQAPPLGTAFTLLFMATAAALGGTLDGGRREASPSR